MPGSSPVSGSDAATTGESARVEQAFLWTFLAIRSVHLLQGVLDVAAGYDSYSRPIVAGAVLSVCLLDCAFILVRCLPRHRLDPVAIGVDVVVGMGGLFVVGATLHGQDRTTSINWMLPYTVGTVLALAGAFGRRRAMLLTLALTFAYLGSVSGDLRAGGSGTTTAIVNAASYVGFYVVAAMVVVLVRRLVGELQRARLEAVASSGRLATAQERNRQHRLLHDHALQSLESIANGWAGEDEQVMALARQEALRLREMLDSDLGGGESHSSGRGLREALGDLVVTFAGAGLHVHLVAAELTSDPGLEGTDALVSAAGEALNNVLKHAGACEVVVRVASSDGGVEVTVRDHGAGFDLDSAHHGFGLDNSVVGRMSDVGGSAEIVSRPGWGTKVVLRLPMPG